MDELSIVLESLTPEQYKKFYKDLPIPSMAIKNKRDEYLKSISNNDNLNKLIELMLDNNLEVSSANNNYINAIVDIKNAKALKYIKEHLVSKNIHVDFKVLEGDVLSANISYLNDRDLSVIINVLENYFLVNRSEKNNIVDNYILKKYMNTPVEYIEYIKEINKDEIMHLTEKFNQETTLPFEEKSDIKIDDYLTNVVSLEEIHKKDNLYSKIPFNKLSDDQKEVMANKYFREVAKKRLYNFNFKIRDLYKMYFTVKYQKQMMYNLDNYGISGNARASEENKVDEIDVFLYPNIKYALIEGNNAKLNTDLVGQIMITTLHEQEHLLQRSGKVNDELKFAIDNFDMICSYNPNYMIDNYMNDPAEIDANLSSFNRFMDLADDFNIDSADKVILNKVHNVQENAEDNMNFYEDYKIETFEDVQNYMYQKLLDSIDNYTNMEQTMKNR